MRTIPLLDRARFDAVLFDLDGVLTSTASMHARLWKKMFDEYRAHLVSEGEKSFPPFEIENDYRPYVDGKPRYDGVRSFLASRDLTLPDGESSDSPGFNTVCALGNRKDSYVTGALAEGGAETFPSSIEFLKIALNDGCLTAVVSSSRNCQLVLQAVEIEDLFDVRMDGRVAEERGLAGKPSPETFLTAASDLGVPPERCIVIEDAIVGVEAGVAGNFGFVLGIARHGDDSELKNAGAHLVVTDLEETLSPADS